MHACLAHGQVRLDQGDQASILAAGMSVRCADQLLSSRASGSLLRRQAGMEGTCLVRCVRAAPAANKQLDAQLQLHRPQPHPSRACIGSWSLSISAFAMVAWEHAPLSGAARRFTWCASSSSAPAAGMQMPGVGALKGAPVRVLRTRKESCLHRRGGVATLHVAPWSSSPSKHATRAARR